MSIPSTSILLDAEKLLTRVGVRIGYIVADLGCGTSGHFVIPAVKLVGPSGKVYAVDILKSALNGVESRAKLEGLTGIETVWADCEVPRGVKIADNSIDVVLVINNLFQSKKRAAFLWEASRIAKPGGKVVLVDWKPAASPLGPPAESRVAPEAAKAAAMSIGLKYSEAFEPGQYFWGLVFSK